MIKLPATFSNYFTIVTEQSAIDKLASDNNLTLYPIGTVVKSTATKHPRTIAGYITINEDFAPVWYRDAWCNPSVVYVLRSDGIVIGTEYYNGIDLCKPNWGIIVTLEELVSDAMIADGTITDETINRQFDQIRSLAIANMGA